VAAQELAVGFGAVGDHGAGGEIEDVLLRFDVHPLRFCQLASLDEEDGRGGNAPSVRWKA